MTNLFSDNVKSNNPVRSQNIDILEKNGFSESGVYSRSGNFYLIELKTKVKLVFGKRCNIAGSGYPKYFSLSKEFSSKDDAMKFWNDIKSQLIIN